MTNDEIFLKYLLEFEPILNRYGYYDDKNGDASVLFEGVGYFKIERRYTNIFLKQRVDIGISFWESKKILISMFMYKPGLDKVSFNLLRFLKKHHLESRIQDLLSNEENFDSFVKNYFESLAVLFENELNDQITGKDFENHWQEEMDEFNDRYR